MPCYHPKQAFLAPHRGINGKQIVRFHYVSGYSEISLPCGRCMGCRVARSREWAIRLTHESKLHEFSSFITLTYSDEFLPEDYGLHKEHWVGFMKRLRAHIEYHHPDLPPLRFYACGEYGEQSLRPHYHAIIFGVAFPDQVVYTKAKGKITYTSPTLEKLWGMGFATVSGVSFANAAYVAGYVQKKIHGERAEKHYRRTNPLTGEQFQVEPEFALMSRRKGIGRDHITQFLSDVYPSDHCIVDGHKAQAPRFYDKVLAELDPSGMETVRAKRKAAAMLPAVKLNNTKSRLQVREEVAAAKRNLTKKGTL